MNNLNQQQIWNLYKEFCNLNLGNNMQKNNNYGINNNMNNNPMRNSMNNMNINMQMSGININGNLSNSFNNVPVNNNFIMNNNMNKNFGMNNNMNKNFGMNNMQMNNMNNCMMNNNMNNNMNKCMMNNMPMNNCMNNMCMNNNMKMNNNNFMNCNFQMNNNNNNNMNNCMMMNNIQMGNCMNNFKMNNRINSNNMNNNINNLNSEVKIKFSFMTAQVFNVTGYLNEKFSELIKRFKDNECPKELKNHLSIPLFYGNKITDTNKTLSQIGITNNSVILFIINNKEEVKKIENKEKKEHKLTEDELIQIKKWQEEYEAKKLIHRILKKKNDDDAIESENGQTINNFLDFIKMKEKSGSITVKEHKHKLVYCLTDFKWKCNICKKDYEKNNARYLCSICNYNMCDECHSKGNYVKKKVFPDGVIPSNTSVNKTFFQTDYHDHRLVYCRSSRSVIGYNGWICDNCRENFDNEIWSFFCTNCDFDLCCSCAGYN